MRWLAGGLLSLALLYCGIAMVVGLVWSRNLPAFPFSWVGWLNRGNLPPLVDHVINFLLLSMMATVFRDMWRHGAARARARNEQV